MLGHVVARYFAEKGDEVYTLKSRFVGGDPDPLVEDIRRLDCEVVINALGAIPQKNKTPAELSSANSDFPIAVKRTLRSGQRLLHASTDCVFRGASGNYSVHSVADAEDPYGLSKRLGESIAQQGCSAVLRSSIIGPDPSGPYGLFEWFMAQRTPVRGFTNHFWNGVTTLQWAKTAWALTRTSGWPALGHLASPERLSKFELLTEIARCYRLATNVLPHVMEPVDRTLVPTFPVPSIRDQLVEMKMWYRR